MKAPAVNHDTTEALVERARSGDRGAFDALLERSRPRLLDSIQSWTRFQLGEPIDVEDVLQDTFIRALGSIRRFEWTGDDAFFRWLCGIAKRSLAQLAKDRRRHGRVQAGSGAREIPDDAPTQSRALRRNERFDRLEAALGELRPEHREVLVLSRIEGLTMREIAERMERSPSTVKFFLAEGLRELRRRFGDTESLHLPDRQLDVEGDDDGD